MKKGMMLVVICLFGCTQLGLDESDSKEQVQIVDADDEVTPHFEEIETLLAQVELEAGLGNLTAASSILSELMAIIHGHEVTQHQQARINTMEILLADLLVSGVGEQIFSGSAAAAKVINMMEEVPVGYTFVYHEIPSLVGGDGLGYYVFLVPDYHAQTSDVEIKKTFFVTEQGEILMIE